MKLRKENIRVLVMKSFQEMEYLRGFDEFWVDSPVADREEVIERLTDFWCDALEIDE